MAKSMTSATAHDILREEFPTATIIESPDNPSVVGWWLFIVNGEPMYVDQLGYILERETSQSQQN